ncbi:MAG: acyl-ACP thioesterase domain-containing protein [Bacteroidota bacterium]
MRETVNWTTTEHFQVRHSETTPNNRISLPALVSLMQEAAWNNALDLGYSVYDLMNHGVTWVLYRMELEVFRYPGHRARLSVTTWPSAQDRLYTYRDYRLHDESRVLLAQATSAWLVLDIEKRKVVPVPSFIKEAEFPQDMDRLPWDGQKLEDLREPTLEYPIQVRWHEEDANGHVNNAHYLEWIMESLPLTFRQNHLLQKLVITFKHETHAGATLRVLAEARGGQGYLHQIVDEENKEMVRALSTFREARTE